ncbi:MAG: hypothetical protein RLZZ312_365 [Bacteroidota bacterium]
MTRICLRLDCAEPDGADMSTVRLRGIAFRANKVSQAKAEKPRYRPNPFVWY